MRVYHIGLPKTGTTSFQTHFHNHPLYIGTRRPETTECPSYQNVTKYLLGHSSKDSSALDIPDTFLYSEELVLAPLVKGHAKATLKRLIRILRPEDRVVISTRHPKDVLFSRYCERYRHLWSYTFKNAVLYHPLFEPYNYTLYRDTIPEELYAQFEFIDYKQMISGHCISTISLLGKYEIKQHQNQREKRKRKTVEYKVEFPQRNFHLISKATNNICCLLFRETRDPVRRFPLLREAHWKENFIPKPSYPRQTRQISKSQMPGLEWLKTNYKIDYLTD